MRVQIAVVVKEEEYARRLADYVRSSSFGMQWQLAAFTGADAFIRYLQGEYAVDLIAIQPAMLEAVRDFIPGSIPVVRLVGSLNAMDADRTELLQYQPIPDLLNGFAAMLAAHAGGAGVVPADDGRTVVVAVSSPVGRTGKTTLALHLAQAAAARNRRPFYFNLERWNGSELQLQTASSTDHGGESGDTEGLSQLLYHVQSRPGKAGEWLAKHALRHPYWKTGYVRPCTNMEDRLSLAVDDASKVIEALKSAGYDYIIVETADGMDEFQLGVLELCDRTAWVLSDDPVAKHKSELMLQYAEQRWPDRYLEVKRTLVTVLNGCTGMSDRKISGASRPAIMLPDVPKWRHSFASEASDSPLYRAASDKLFMSWLKEGEGRGRSGMVG